MGINDNRVREIRRSVFGRDVRKPIAKSVERIRNNRDIRVGRIELLHSERINEAEAISIGCAEFKSSRFYEAGSYVFYKSTHTYWRLLEDHQKGVSFAKTKKIQVAWEEEDYDQNYTLALNRANGE